MKLCKLSALLVLLTAASLPALASNENPESARPRVGLVLGGGGARGAAHIGVLRELERQRIPVDAIVGTSMGAIVGGLYASGMTVPELEELVASLDWAAAFTDSSDRRNKRYRRKQDDAAFPVAFEMGYRDSSFRFPKGVLQGQRIALILRELTLGVSDLRDFDELPIPYRAVASDLVTGEAEVLGDGDLAVAIRASMSAPGILAPVELGDKLLVDGGLVGNVPVEAMQELGVDVIIAVDVEFPLYKAEEIQSAVSVSAQMLTILIRKETRRQLALLGDGDTLIRPDLGELGSTDFAKITEAIEPGAAAARGVERRLAAVSLGEQEYRRHLEQRRRKPGERSIDFVRFVDDGTLSPRVLEARIATRPGDPVDPDRLAADASHLHGLQLYEQVDYRLTEEDGQQGVEFVARQKDWGPNFLQYRVSLQDNLQGDTSFDIAARLTRSGMNLLNGEWRTDLQLGTESYLFSEFYQPLSFDSRYFVAPRVVLDQRNFNVFADSSNVARYRISQAGGGLDLGRELGRWGEVRLGMLRGYGHTGLKIGDPDFPTDDFNVGGLFASFNVDTRDDAQIPHTGTRFAAQWIGSRTGLGADDAFETLDVNYSGAWSFGRHTLNAGLRYATSRNSDQLIRNYFTLGGFLNLSGLTPGELSGPHAALARLVYYRRSGEVKGTLDTPLYVGASLEAGNTWASRPEMSFGSSLKGGSLFVGADTFIGAVFLAAGYTEGGNKSLYLSVGNDPLLR